MRGLRIILDKSVVYGLNNAEVDALDRYFFQIVPPILRNEILADLTKESELKTITNKIAAHSYRICGNSGIAESCRQILGHSLIGHEIPMDGRFIPAGGRTVQTLDGDIGTVISTKLEDEQIARWERKQFSPEEREGVRRWRIQIERKLDVDNYLKKIVDAGIEFFPPETDEDLVDIVDRLLTKQTFQGKLLYFLFKEWMPPREYQIKVMNRWFAEKKPFITDFAPYAAFCLRVELLWAIGHSNPRLFKVDRNDRKDLQYCYYLPHCEIFASKDKKHARLVPILQQTSQSFVDGDELKKDLARLSERWNDLSKEQQIREQAERGDAPPENEDSIVYQLWKKHSGKLNPPLPVEIAHIPLVDSRLPKDQQKPFTLAEFIKLKSKELDAARDMSVAELERLREIEGDTDPTSFAVHKSLVNKERLFKMNPQLKDKDLD